MDERIAAAWSVLPEHLGQHVLLSAAAIGLGLALSLSLTVAATRSPRLRWPVLLFASLVQTLAGLALLALFYPLLLALAAVSERLFGHGFSALGFLPSLLALTLYSMLLVIRNGTGILGLDPTLIEAARGVGMTDSQRLMRVELPLAAPVLMAGIRTAAVWVIGAATLSTLVGQTSLGNYIFSGLQVQNWVAVLFGCVATAALAIVADQLLRSSRQESLAGAAATSSQARSHSSPASRRRPQTRNDADTSSCVIGAKNFTEQYILSALLADRVAAEGGSATRRTGLGSAIAFNALVAGDIDAYVDYSGTIWANVMRRTDTPSHARLLEDMREWLVREHGVALLGRLGFENAYALAMRRDRAAALGIRSIADLAKRSSTLTIGADFEFFVRPEWEALRDAYSLQFASRREFQSTFMYDAVATREVDVITAFSSDGRIAANDLVVLEDPQRAILPYDAIVLLAARRANDPVLRRAIEPLVDAIPVELMRAANQRVDRREAPEPPVAAARWLGARVAEASN